RARTVPARGRASPWARTDGPTRGHACLRQDGAGPWLGVALGTDGRTHAGHGRPRQDGRQPVAGRPPWARTGAPTRATPTRARTGASPWLGVRPWRGGAPRGSPARVKDGGLGPRVFPMVAPDAGRTPTWTGTAPPG